MSATPLRQAGLAGVARSAVRVPLYDRGALEPRIAHIGVGGFLRSHLALYTENVAAQGGAWGIAGLGSRAEDAAIAAALTQQDTLYTLIEKGDGEPTAAVIGALLSVRHAPPGADAAMTELIAAAPTAILSLTITEAGYAEPSDAESAAGTPTTWPVVAEPFRQWVLEDDFAAGRPAWEHDGALFSDRVGDWELYKLRLLNAGHSSMAYLASLARITYVDEAMATPAMRAFVEQLLRREALPTLDEIPGHTRETYVSTVLERFESVGVRDQIHRLCQDGSAKLPAFLIPTIVAQLRCGGPIARATTALAGWARYLAVTDEAEQAFDASGVAARAHAAGAVGDPRAFLDFDAVFPPELRESDRFATAFVEAYRRIVEDGPLAACAAACDASRSELPR